MKEKRSWDEQVFSGFRIVGWILLTVTIFGALLWGAGVAFSIRSGFKAAGWVVLLSAFAIVALTVERWAKFLSGLLLLATLNGLLMVKTGHLINNPNVPVPRQVALAMVLLFAATTAFSIQFHNRKLGVVDRIALLSYVACFLWGFVSRMVLLPLALGLMGFVLAWANHRIRRGRLTTSA